MGVFIRARLRHRIANAAVLGALALAASAAHSAGAISFEDAIRAAGERSPAVLAAQSRLAAARHEVGPAGELPDPRLALGLDNVPTSGVDRFTIDRDSMSAFRVELMQELPNRDKREARVELALAEVDRADAQRRLAGATARREAAMAWLRRHSVERQLSLFDGLFKENALFAEAVRARLAGGSGSAADTVTPRQELARLSDRRDALLAGKARAIAALRQWIGDAAEAPLDGTVPGFLISREVLAASLEVRPEVIVYQAAARSMDAEIRAAESAKKPDWGVALAYQRRGQGFGDMVMVEFSFDLPIFSAQRQDPRIAARRAQRAGVDAERSAVLRERRQGLESALAEYERVGQAHRRARDVLLPLAIEKADLTLAGYRGGTVELGDVIAARQERIEAQLRVIELEGELLVAAAELRFGFGTSEILEQAK
jgi:outer membrane protein TolC